MPTHHDKQSRPEKAVHWIVNVAARGLLGLALMLPYDRRVPFFGKVVTHFVGPLAGYRRRAIRHIAKIYPDKTPQEHRALAAACLDNMGRCLIESFSTMEFFERMTSTRMSGPGVRVLEDATKNNQAVILVTGHFGNYEAARAAMVHKGYTIGAIYRYMANPYFNEYYVKALHAFGGPGFPQGKRGTGAAVRHLKDGGKLVLLFDQHVKGAPVLDFLGHPAKTAISAAQLALKYNALLVPYYSIRQADGVTFEAVFEDPIPHSDATTMTEAMNASLEARIKAHPEQWFWVPRRWRPDE